MAGIDPATLQRIKAFRIEELKACLRQLNLPISGRKADLQGRLTAVIQAGLPQPNYQPDMANRTRAQHASAWIRVCMRVRSHVVDTGQIVATVFREANLNKGGHKIGNFVGVETIVPGANNNVPTGLPGAAAAAPAPTAGTVSRNTRIRCICGRNYDTPQMIQCGTAGCGTWQHCSCVGLMSGRTLPKHYICVTCRMARADPFWEPVGGAGFDATKLNPPSGFYTGMLRLDRVFTLSREHFAQLRQPNSNLQLWAYSVRADDEVPNRFLWPNGTSLLVNNMGCRATNRSSSYPSKTKTRDAPLSIGNMAITGNNSLTITCSEQGAFAVGVQLMKKRSAHDVRRLMLPKESLAEAVQRVCSIIRGPDADDELVALSTTVALRDPLTSCRITKPARFVNIRGLQAFDLDAFLSTVEATRKWVDPMSDQACTIFQLQEDVYLEAVLRVLASHPNIEEVEVAPDGRWRPRGMPQQAWIDVREPAARLTIDSRNSHQTVQVDDEGLTNNVGDRFYSMSASRKRKASSPIIISLISDDEDTTPAPSPAPPVGIMQVAAPRATPRSAPAAAFAPSILTAPAPPRPAPAVKQRAASVPQTIASADQRFVICAAQSTQAVEAARQHQFPHGAATLSQPAWGVVPRAPRSERSSPALPSACGPSSFLRSSDRPATIQDGDEDPAGDDAEATSPLQHQPSQTH